MMDANARESVSMETFGPVWDAMVMLDLALKAAIESEGLGNSEDSRHIARKAELMNEARVRLALERNTFTGFVMDLQYVTRPCEHFGRWTSEQEAAA